jgi:hypothetical protein
LFVTYVLASPYHFHRIWRESVPVRVVAIKTYPIVTNVFQG